MLVSLRREYAHLVTSGGQLLLLFVGFKLETRNGWLFSLTAIACISVFAWLSALRRLRAVRDTPTSTIASAAQGYVEFIGNGLPFGEAPLLSKHSLLPCLWYRYTVEQRNSSNKWKTIDSGESDDLFMLRDDNGECIVNPEQAEIITQHRDQWQESGNRYTEWKLLKQDRLYIIGQFRTQGGSNLEFNSRAELNALLAEWKKNMPTLNARFDLDKNGVLDMQEWQLARQSAKREVAKKLREAQAQTDINLISRPADGRLFLISNMSQKKISRRYLFWSWAHLLIFFTALTGINWLLQGGDFQSLW